MAGGAFDNQIKASDPSLSAWVGAHAGSGKTYVLAHRVIRLLLRGADPAKILCLTFTKAAAANMSARVFKILGEWIEFDDARLKARIREIGEPGFGAGGANDLAFARQLFARAIETPGGLKIQTIHAFCERLLHQFPFEANVSARFEIADEDQAKSLLESAIQTMYDGALANPQGEPAAALAVIAAQVDDRSFAKALAAAITKRAALRYASTVQSNGLQRELAQRLGLEAADVDADFNAIYLNEGIKQDEWRDIANTFDVNARTGSALAKRVHAMMAADGIEAKVEAYKRIFIKADGEPYANGFLVKDWKEANSARVEQMYAERDRVAGVMERFKAAQLLARSAALTGLANQVLQNYQEQKSARGLLDFEDMIERTAALFKRSDAGWILYKLDAGIDHVLVDEAQDTSPVQWSILRSIVEDFFAGESARGRERTFFAVGDEKQSIFSFQGAEPKSFGENRDLFAKRITSAELRFEPVNLLTSFRSSQVILNFVDKVFETPEHFRGLSVDADAPQPHSAHKMKLPGLVELWPLVASAAEDAPEDWRMPLDMRPAGDSAGVLAQRIAAHIAALLKPENGEAVHDEHGAMRAVRPGDIMILVRRRNELFEALIRALKLNGVPVAGADRLHLTQHIAIEDLIAVGRAALLPQDDFTLACVMKSPLAGFNDDDLIALAPNRTGTLQQALLDSAQEAHREFARRLGQWSEQARGWGPFQFYAHLLGAQGGRKQFLARFGHEANDAIDEFLRLALDFENQDTASLAAFLHWMEQADVEIKRDMEAAGSTVRVMTVHAAKGLEAKIIYLPDKCTKPVGRHDDNVITLGDTPDESLLVWRTGEKKDPAAATQLRDEGREQAIEEYHRLLYVALTRAEERLYLSGYTGSDGKADESCWYAMCARTLEAYELDGGAQDTAAVWDKDESVLRVGQPARLADEGEHEVRADDTDAMGEAPAWLHRNAPGEMTPLPPLRPSHTMAAADQLEPSGAPAAAGARTKAINLPLLEGTLAHTLLHYLPQIAADDRRSAGTRFLDQRATALPPERRAALLEQALTTLAAPELAALFGPDSRGEVAFGGWVEIRPGQFAGIAGRIDRLAQTPQEVLIGDFKTGARASASSVLRAGYVRQMALYRAALAGIFPGKNVRACLIWTGDVTLEEIPGAEMDAALAALTGT